MLLFLSGLAAIEFPAQGKFTCDTLGQLTNAPAFTAAGAPIAAEQISYKYDAAWNLNTRTSNGSIQTFGVNNRNQNTATPYGAAAYDLNGNLTQRGDHRFEYDAENQLVRLYRDYLGTLYERTDFNYDGLGRRKRMVPGLDEIRESAKEKAGRIVSEALRKLRWTEKDLEEPRKGDVQKVRMARRLRRRRR
jgi:hypothetical protein